MLAVEFADTPRAYSILAYGESSKPGSAHRDHQLEMFADNRMKRIAFSDADVARQMRREYRPGATN